MRNEIAPYYKVHRLDFDLKKRNTNLNKNNILNFNLSVLFVSLSKFNKI